MATYDNRLCIDCARFSGVSAGARFLDDSPGVAGVVRRLSHRALHIRAMAFVLALHEEANRVQSQEKRSVINGLSNLNYFPKIH